jgi:HSP20 family protein
MAKNRKEEAAVRKPNGGKTQPAAGPTRMLSPMRAWEREIDRAFGDFFHWPRLRGMEHPFPRDLRMEAPSLDVYEEKSDVVVKAEMPGMSKDDIDITLSDSTLTLKGEKKKEEEVKEKDYYRCERQYGSFYRTVELPSEVKSDGVKATFKDGVLEVRLAKSAEPKKKEIHVKVS